MFTNEDALQLKKEFPLFSDPDNAHLVYFDNAATTQKPAAVIDAVADFYRHSNANAHRSSHRLARKATHLLEHSREQTAKFVGAESSDEIIFCRGATESLNLLAYSISSTLRPGDEIILSKAEHHANIVPWQMAAQRTGIVLKYLPSGGYDGLPGKPDLQSLPVLLTARTRVIALTAASNMLGFTLDLHEVKLTLDRLPKKQRDLIRFIVDASQILAHQVVNVQSIGCDFLVGSAHKFYGPLGVGILYARRSALCNLPPWQGGGEMISQVGLFDSQYAEGVHLYEAGTASLASIVGLGRCIEFLNDLDRESIQAHETRLLTHLNDHLMHRHDVTVLSSAQDNVGILTFMPNQNIHIQDLAYWLDEQEIALRLGRHCAHPLADELGISTALRASLAAYNSESDVERFVQALDEGLQSLAQAPGVLDVGSSGAWMSDDLSDLSLASFEQQPNWQLKYRQMLHWGEKITQKDWLRQDQFLLSGCEAKAWFHYQYDRDHYHFFIDSDSRVVKGLAVLLLLQVDNKTKKEINGIDLKGHFTRLGLEKNMSQSRNNGFIMMIQRVEDILSER